MGRVRRGANGWTGLGWLITQRSEVQILPPLPRRSDHLSTKCQQRTSCRDPARRDLAQNRTALSHRLTDQQRVRLARGIVCAPFSLGRGLQVYREDEAGVEHLPANLVPGVSYLRC